MEGLRCVWRGFDLEGFSFFSKKMETPTQKIFFFKMAYGRHIYIYVYNFQDTKTRGDTVLFA